MSRALRFRAAALLLFLTAAAYSQTTSVQLTFVGDIMVHTPNYLTRDYSAIYRSVEPLLRRDDLSFANLEFPVDPSRPFSSYPRFNGSPQYVEAAVEAGIDVFSLANNHAFDQGLDGVAATLATLQRLGRHSYRRLHSGGIRATMEKPFDPVEIRCKGLRIGFLSICQMVNVAMPRYHVHIVDYHNRRHLEHFLPYIREAAPKYDLFVVSYHGGREYSRRPEAAKLRFFETLLEAGVDIVWGHHPHVVQPHFLVDHRDGRKLIMPSTGNLISGMPVGLNPEEPEHELAWTVDSAVWLVTVEVGGDRASVSRVAALPIVNYITPRGEVHIATFPNLAARRIPAPWREFHRERTRLVHVNLASTALRPAPLSVPEADPAFR